MPGLKRILISLYKGDVKLKGETLACLIVNLPPGSNSRLLEELLAAVCERR